MWVPKLLLSPVKIRFFCIKTTQIGPKIAFLGILRQALPAHLVPYWWVGWWLWRVGCISQDTYLIYVWEAMLGWSLLLFMCRPTNKIKIGQYPGGADDETGK